MPLCMSFSGILHLASRISLFTATFAFAMSNAREEILDRIRQALVKPDAKPVAEPDMETDVHTRSEEVDLAIVFAEVFAEKAGQLIYVENYPEFYTEIAAFVKERGYQHVCCWESELAQALDHAGVAYVGNDKGLDKCDASITLCEALVARTGSVVVSSAQKAGRRLTIYPPVHIVVATVSQIFYDIGDALEFVKELYAPGFPSMVSLVTGPSRTADIEKTLVMGAHGPKELVVFLVDDTEIGDE